MAGLVGVLRWRGLQDSLWMRKSLQRLARTQTSAVSEQNSEDRNAPITAHQRDINGTA